MTRQPYQLLCVECGAIRPTLRLPVVQTNPVEQTLGPLVGLSLSLFATQLPDSALETTRVFWRKKFGATDDQAYDPRPWMEVINS